tara:strand:+ start:5764 stop:6747 length:984 start_codon:yes stop_codon:yes gene_type:complete
VIKKPLLIVPGEPNSIFSEILFKSIKYNSIPNNFNRSIIIIGSKKLLEAQAKKLKYSISFFEINIKNFNLHKLNKKKIYIIDIKYKFKKIFDEISSKSNNYIIKCFDLAINILKKNNAYALINGPISKENFLRKKYLGITEYLSKKISNQIKPVMLIYNSNISVSPVTTHLPIKLVSKNLSIKKIIHNVQAINSFYKHHLKKNVKFAILGLNPHCETVLKFSEEKKIIIPAMKKLIKKKIKIAGPFSADTFFLKKNIDKFDVVIGMYHDQVIAPLKALYKFNAINITLGLPFIRVSPDHGPNIDMAGKNKSDPKSLLATFNFFKKIK